MCRREVTVGAMAAASMVLESVVAVRFGAMIITGVSTAEVRTGVTLAG